MSIITKRGDDGHTDLLFSRRAPKTSQRIAALGSVDELNAAIGLARVSGLSNDLITILDNVQKHLVAAMGQIATLPQDRSRYTYSAITPEDVQWVEKISIDWENKGVRFIDWARPGAAGAVAAAHLDVARTIARRAERDCRILHESDGPLDHEVLIYFNRLSDLLWILARVDERQPHPSTP